MIALTAVTEMPSWAVLNIFSAVLVAFTTICSYFFLDSRSLANRVFRTVCYLALTMIICDSVSEYNGTNEQLFIVTQIAYYLYFILSPITIFIWMFYSYSQISDKKKGKTRTWFGLCLGICLADVLLSNISLANGMIWHFTPDRVYKHGFLFPLHTGLMVIMVIINELYLFFSRKEIERKYFISLMSFPLLPACCMVVQAVFVGLSWTFMGLGLALLVVLLNVQSRSVDIDYLTGAYNRRKLDNYIEQKISSVSENKSFSAIILDLDHFKEINDRYGHIEGDKALEDTVLCLKRASNNGDLIARYGGDEFCVVTNIASKEELDDYVKRMHQEFASFNKGRKKGKYPSDDTCPYCLSFSAGYDVYDVTMKMDVEKFQQHIDKLMYEDKVKNHKARK
jgi:diguanylate cyclase (GGDEF)-like protein